MDNPSDNDKSPVDETTHSSGSGQTDVEVASTHTITVTSGSFKAEIQVKLELSADGRTLNYTAVQYWANRSMYTAWGYLFVKFQSGGAWSSGINLEEVNMNSQWTSINRGGSIASNGVNAKVEFRFLWRMAWGSGDPVDVITSPTFDLVTTPPTPSIGPNKNFTASTFDVTGAGAIAGANMVLDHGGGTLAARVQPTAGAWSVPVTVAEGTNAQRIQAYQQVYDRNSDRTGYITAYRAKLTSPTNNSIMPAKDFKFTGIAAPNTSVRVVPGGGAAIWSSTANTGGTSSWQASPLPAFSGSGEKHITAELDGVPHYTVHILFRYLDYPVITNTLLTVPLGFTLTGGNRLSGATVTAYIGASNTVVGTAAAGTTDTFSIPTTNLDPGAHPLTVEQFHSSKGSGRSKALTFNVKPNPPTVTSTTTGERVKLHGTGFRGGQLHFHQPGNGETPLFSVDIKSDGTFEYDVPLTQLPGLLTYSCRQSVLGVAPARIYSDGWVALQTTIPTPAPTQLISSGNGHKLTFSGRGMNWTTNTVVMVIYNNGVDMRTVVPGVPQAIVANGIWAIASTDDFPPGIYDKLTARMWVNSVFSSYANVPPVTIPSPEPKLTPITAPTSQRPQIKGTMWNGSKVYVSVNGGTAQLATTTGASFHLDATSDWAPGTYTVSVTAESGGQTSIPSTQSLTVRTPQPKILTTGPVPLIATVQGTGWSGCRVKIFTTIGNRELGAGEVKTDHTFEITLLKQAAGEQTLYAVQHESGVPANESIESDRVTVKFGVPTADVTVPGPGGRTPRVSTFSGTTTAKSGSVELWLGTTRLRDNVAITNGTWSASGIKLDAGSKAVLVYIRDGSDLSAPTTRNVTVVPETLKIDSPLTHQNVGRLAWVSGVGAFPGDEVIVKRLGAPHNFPHVTVNEHGQWTTNLQHNMVAGNTLAAIARAGVGLDSDLSDSIIPKLLHSPPHFTQPQAGDRTGTKPIFAGLARPGATVTVASWFNSTNVLATTVADADGRWQVQSNVALAAGGNWVQVRDALGGQDSEWRRSEYFEVKPATTASIGLPSIQRPLMDAQVGKFMSLSGRGLPGATVQIVRENAIGDVLGTAIVDRYGHWAVVSTRELQVLESPLRFSVRQSRDGITSGWGTPNRSVEVIAVGGSLGRPVITVPANDPVAVLEPNPIIAGTGFPRAVVKVYLDDAVTIIAETTVRADGRWETRCNTALIAGPHKLSAHQHLDGGSVGSNLWVEIKIGAKPLPPLITNIAAEDDVSHNLVLEGRAMPSTRVDLYKKNVNSVIGSGTADKNGLWTIKLYNLPIGEFIFGAKTVHGTTASDWTPDFKVYVHNFG